MADFAKLFVVNGQQLLVFMDPDSDSDDLVLHQMIDVGGAVIDLKIKGREETVEAIFSKIDQQSAENFFETDIVRRLTAQALYG